MLWSQSFLPSLTLDFDRPGYVRLLDADDKELGSAPIDHSAPPDYPFCGVPIAYHGILFRTDTRERKTTVYSGKRLLWSGPRPANDGVRIGHSLDSPIQGVPYAPYPAGETITLLVTKKTGSMSVTDKDSHLLEIVPAEVFQMESRCDDQKFVNSNLGGTLFLPHTAMTQAEPLAPGQLYVYYHAANGSWIAGELVRAEKDTRQFLGSPMPIFLPYHEPLEVRTTHLNEMGEVENPLRIEYGWFNSV